MFLSLERETCAWRIHLFTSNYHHVTQVTFTMLDVNQCRYSQQSAAYRLYFLETECDL